MVSFPSRDQDVAPVVSLTEHRRTREPDEREVHAGEDLAEYEAAATRVLSRRDLSRKELVEHLVGREASSATADVVVARMEELGYVDDTRVAAELVRRRVDRQGKTRKVVLRELLSRGIDSATADEALEAVDDEAERRSALELAEKRARQISGADDAAVERRLTAFLLRRGYDGDVVREAVSHARSSIRTRVRFR